MKSYDEILAEITSFNQYLDKIIAKGHENDFNKLVNIYTVIKKMIDSEKSDTPSNVRNISNKIQIDSNIILYKNNEELLNKFTQFMNTMEYY